MCRSHVARPLGPAAGAGDPPPSCHSVRILSIPYLSLNLSQVLLFLTSICFRSHSFSSPNLVEASHVSLLTLSLSNFTIFVLN